MDKGGDPVKSIFARLERLEAAKTGAGVSVGLLDHVNGAWRLICIMNDGERRVSTHKSEAEAHAAYDALCKPGKVEPVLIVIGL